jgi:microcystin-dependent protein
MAEQFLAEIRIMSFNFPPKGWASCNGQLLPISQNQALFALLGTMFGGNGQTNFALPNLRGRTPVHRDGSSYTVGQSGGTTSHTVSVSEMPQHIHTVVASADLATSPTPGGALPAAVDVSTFQPVYADPASLVAMAPQSVGNTGGSQPHENMQPYLTLNFCIALQGIFPSQN